MEQERGFPVVSIISTLVLALIVLLFSISGAEPEFASMVLSAATSVAALSAALVSAHVLIARGFLLDPLAGLALLYAVPGFLLASAGWALDATNVHLQLGPLELSKWLWYTSALLIMVALWELGATVRRLAGLKHSEALVAVGLPLAYAAALALVAAWFEAPLVRIAETLASSVLLMLSLLALLPIRRKRYSWGLTLMAAGSASFTTAVPLVSLLAPTVYAPLPIALYTLSFILAASGVYVYGGESVFLR